MSSEPSLPGTERSAALTGEIIVLTRRIETLLRRAAPEDAAGIHALTEAQTQALPEALRRKLHYLGSVRNQAAHDETFTISEENFAVFRQCAEEVETELRRRLGPDPPAGSGAAAPGAGPDAGALEIEKELWERWGRTLRLLGFLPVLGALNLLVLLLGALWRQIATVLLLAFYFCAVPMIAEGLRDGTEAGRMLLYLGLATAAGDYIGTVILRRAAPMKGRIGLCGYLPAVHVVYLAARIFRKLEWGRVLLALAGLGTLIGAGIMLWHEKWDLAGYTLLAHWILSIAGSLRGGKARQKPSGGNGNHAVV